MLTELLQPLLTMLGIELIPTLLIVIILLQIFKD